MDKKEFRESRVAHRDDHEPRRSQQKENKQPRAPVHTSPELEITPPQAYEHQYGARNQDADQALAQHGAGHGSPRNPDPGSALLPAGRCELCNEHCAQRQRHEQRQAGIERQEVAVADDPRHRRHDRRAADTRVPVPESSAGQTYRHDGQEACQRRPQARGELVDAEQLEQHCANPVLEWRLLEIKQPVQAGRYPVTTVQHLQGDGGVPSLIGMDQGARAGAAKPHDSQCEDHPPQCICRYEIGTTGLWRSSFRRRIDECGR